MNEEKLIVTCIESWDLLEKYVDENIENGNKKAECYINMMLHIMGLLISGLALRTSDERNNFYSIFIDDLEKSMCKFYEYIKV